MPGRSMLQVAAYGGPMGGLKFRQGFWVYRVYRLYLGFVGLRVLGFQGFRVLGLIGFRVYERFLQRNYQACRRVL